ncbi:Probable LRR receptor-like serine/threonine-protein kinase At3g47570 [Linum perenne]
MKETHKSSLLKLILLSLLLSFNFPYQSNASGSNETDRLALLEFKKSVMNDPDGVLNSWNSSIHFCNWQGITCIQQQLQQRVISLVLPGHNLGGDLSPHIGNLTSLQSINLDRNSFRGQIPSHFGNLASLQFLNLTRNLLRGEIPVNLTRCSQLREIWLGGNGLVGKIPEEIGVLSNLKVLRISTNNLTGKIPASLGNMSQLENFGVPYNNLAGQIPESVGRLSRLSRFVVGINQLTGQVPSSLYNLSSITILTLVYNQFEGRIPDDIGFTLPNLVAYGNSRNLMYGPIPESLCNASQLTDINMNRNSFTGRIPSCLGNLQQLLYFNAGDNTLGNNSSGDFEFITSLSNCSLLEEIGVSFNNLGGPLPTSVGNLSVQLYQLDLEFNSIKGDIPDVLENLINLNKITLSNNLFTGSIPTYIGKFKDLQGLWMQGNLLTGQIPSSIGNLTKLNLLDISNNRLQGAIPLSLGNCQQLNQLDVSANKFTGEIPGEVFRLSSLSVALNLSRNLFNGSLGVEIGNLTNLEVLDVSYNNLSGGIPASISGCKNLKKLYMQVNSLNGSIPDVIVSLQGMESLDLSMNNFTGRIPVGLQNFEAMQHLNLSYNDLQGEVPSKGIFRNASGMSLMGNSRLCGGISDLHLQDCPTEATAKQKRVATIKLTVIIVLVSLFFFSLVGLLYYFKVRSSKKQTSVGDSALTHYMMVSYKDLHQATNGFSSDNLIGSGGFGTIYKGVLDQVANPVAVKVLNIHEKKAYKSLLAECNALKSVRHRNLVRILTYCSSLDHKGNDFKALVFEFMSNGSLEDWLHHPGRNLSLVQRLNIAVDVASALHYLHDDCETPVVHCDLKPSNVLLDADMVARVGDFGLARILSTDNNSSSSSKSSTVGIKGTIGYAPPEYGMGAAVWKEGDVYSYGILILEMFTGKRPTDEMFSDELNLRDLVKEAIPGRLSYVLDPSMALPVDGNRRREAGADDGTEVMEEMELTESGRDCLVSVLETAVSCAAESSRERMKMANVARKLVSVRDAFVASTYAPSRRPQRD